MKEKAEGKINPKAKTVNRMTQTKNQNDKMHTKIEIPKLKCYVLATRRDTLEESDARIAKALHELEQSPHGRRTLNDLQLLLSADAKGLDSSGLEALATLVLEFASGRRTMI